MKRFNLRNKKSGLLFSLDGESLPSRQPEWGRPQRRIMKAIATPEELAESIGTEIDPTTGGELLVLPDEMEILSQVDLTAEIAAKADAETKLEEAVTRLRAVKKSDLNSVSACADAIIDCKRVILRLAKGD